MRFTIIIILVFYIVFNSNSQNRLDLRICNTQKKALVFVNVYNVNNKTGSISGNKGVCSVNYLTINDTILCSYIGYKRKRICVKNIKNDTIFLEKKIYSIPSVNIIGVSDKDYIIKQLFEIIRINKKRNYKINAQSNLVAESYIDDSIPQERVESIGNIIGGLNSKFNFDIVMGQFGQNSKFNFYNLAINSMLEKIALFNSNRKTVFPKKITEISKRKIKRMYNLSIINIDSFYQTIRFMSNNKDYFSGEITYNKKDKFISYLRLYIENPLTIGIKPIFNTDTLQSKHFEYQIEFSKFSYKLSYINIIHNYDYSKKGKRYSMTSNIVIFPIKYGNTFPKSISNLYFQTPSIYDQIIITPHIDNFWSKYFFINRFKDSYTFDFFKNYGYITNYDIYSNDTLFPFLNKKIRLWNNRTRVTYDDFAHNSKDFGINESLVNSYNMKYLPSELYNFNITYDLFFFDTIFVVKTILDFENSYYFLEKNYQNLVAINIYIDIFEKNRKELQKQLNTTNDVNKAKDLTNKYFTKSNKEAKSFFARCEKGNNTDTLVYWNSIIYNRLGVNNIDILKDSRFNKQVSNIDYYNIGTALLSIGNYAESIVFFTDDLYILNHTKLDAKVYNERIINTLVNRAIAYISLHKYKNACKDLHNALNLGDKEASYYIERYCKSKK